MQKTVRRNRSRCEGVNAVNEGVAAANARRSEMVISSKEDVAIFLIMVFAVEAALAASKIASLLTYAGAA